MTVSIISSENKTANGNITIPAAASLIYAIVKGAGATTPPKINSLQMFPFVQIEQNAAMPAVGIYQRSGSSIEETLPLEFSGTHCLLVYTQGGIALRPGASTGGQSASGSYSTELPTSASDLVLGILAGSIGPTAIKGDSVEFNYLLNTATEKIGYIIPADSSLTCLVTDTGISSGYYADGGTLYHPRVLVKEAYSSFDPVLHTVTYQYDHHDTPWMFDYYRRYDNGVYTGLVTVPKGVLMSISTYYDYPEVKHPAEYIEAYTEDLPDVWVPGGTAASLSAAFVSIRPSDSGFVPRPMIF